MRDAVREHFANPPPGSKLRAAIDFGVDISLMDPPKYSDRALATSGGRIFNVLLLDALLRIKKRLNRVKDQLAVPEIEALIEIRDLERGS